MSNERIREVTDMKDINLDIKERRWRWIGHVYRMKNSRRPRQAMDWTPKDKGTGVDPGEHGGVHLKRKWRWRGKDLRR